jgi:hypothetical protein
VLDVRKENSLEIKEQYQLIVVTAIGHGKMLEKIPKS